MTEDIKLKQKISSAKLLNWFMSLYQGCPTFIPTQNKLVKDLKLCLFNFFFKSSELLFQDVV